MANHTLAFVAFLLLVLFLSSADRSPLDSDSTGVVSESSDPAAIRLPSDRPDSTTEGSSYASTVDTRVQEANPIPLEVSFIPLGRDFPHPHPRPRVVGHSFWRRLGRHCHHMHRGPHGGMQRGVAIPYGDDMIVPAEQVRRGYEGGRFFAEADHKRMMPMMREEISVEELAKQGGMGLPRELRPFPRFRPEKREEGFGGLVNRFLDLLNRH